MLSLRTGPIARRLQLLTDRARTKVRQRQKLREAAAALAGIRTAIVDTGIDPVDNPGLKHYAGAERCLAQIRDTAALCQADAAFIAADPSFARGYSLAAVAAARIRPTLDRPPPDTGDSPLDWYVWSLTCRGEIRPPAPP